MISTDTEPEYERSAACIFHFEHHVTAYVQSLFDDNLAGRHSAVIRIR